MTRKTTTRTSSSVRTTERRRRLSTTIEAAAVDAHLDQVALLLSEGFDLETPPHLIRLSGVGAEAIDIGLRPIDDVTDSVLDALTGFRAPSEWQVIGAATGGTARSLDDLEAEGMRVHIVHLVSRAGGTASAIRFGADPPRLVEGEGSGDGRVDDACRRALDLPTSPPQTSTIELFAAQWLDNVLAIAAPRDARQLSWAEVARLHPALQTLSSADPALADAGVTRLVRLGSLLGEVLDWPALRASCERTERAVEGITAELARWHDDGSFSRAVLAQAPPLELAVAALDDLLPASIVRRVRSTLRAWDVAA